MKKHVLYIALALFFLNAAPVHAQGKSAPSPIPSDEEIIAKQNTTTLVTVNGQAIPTWMFDNALRDTLAQAEKAGNAGRGDILKKRRLILHNLIDMEVLAQEAVKRGMQVNVMGGALRSQIIKGRYKTKDGFRRTLAAAGMTEQQFVAIWQQQASVNKLVDEVVLKDIVIHEEEIAARYEQDKGKYTRKPKVKASHILVAVDKEASGQERAAARQKANAIRQELIAGKDFAALARETGGFPSAERGGDLGWFSHDRMLPAFSDAAFALPLNGVSQVIETKYGFHIIKKTGEKGTVAGLEEIRGQLTHIIQQEKGRKAFLALRDQLLSQAELIFHDKDMEEAYGTR